MNIIEAMEQLKAGKELAGGTQKFRQCSLKMDSIKFLQVEI